MKKYISIILVVLLVFTLIPIQAFAFQATQVHVKNVPSSVTEVYVNFSSGTSLSCTKYGSGNNWKLPDGGTYVSDNITGVTIVWNALQRLTIGRSGLTFGTECGGTLNLTIKGCPQPPTLYAVTYQYTGTVPSGAPSVPSSASYTAGTDDIAVASNPTLANYTFSGWTTTNTTVTNGKFTMPCRNVVFTGTWTKSQYNVSYQYAGTVPTGAPAVPSGGNYTWGTDNISVSSNPTLSNYTFSGWTTDDVTVSSGKFTMPKKDVVFTGTWAKDSYDVKYCYTGTVPTGAPSAPSSEDYTWGTTGIAVASNPTLASYTFSGWATDDVTVTGGTFTMPKHDVVFTGCFTKAKYNVSYQYTGTVPPGAPSLPSGGNYTWGTDNIHVSSNPTLPGYTFSGWTTDDVSVWHGKFTMPKQDVVFTGTWVKNSYDVKYYYTGTVPPGVPSAPSSEDYTWGTTGIAVASNPTLSGYTFSGWTTDDVTVTNGTFTMPKKDVVFVGCWTKCKYNVSYQYTGTVPPGAPSLPSGGNYTWGTDDIHVSSNPTLPGYTFSGWTTDDVSVWHGKFTMPKQDVVFTGTWTKITHNVTYQYTGTVPTGAPELPASASYAWGTSGVDVAANPTLEGYTFSGWVTTNATVTNGEFTMPCHNVVFTGSFTKIPYNVTYQYTGTVPTGAPALPSGGTYDWGTAGIAVAANPTLTGYTFSGWVSADITPANGTFTMPRNHVTFTASFTKIAYNVTYQYTGTVPTGAPALPSGGTYDWGTAGIAVAANPTLTGYTFSGWVSDDVTVTSGTFTMPENHVIFTASFTKNEIPKTGDTSNMLWLIITMMFSVIGIAATTIYKVVGKRHIAE